VLLLVAVLGFVVAAAASASSGTTIGQTFSGSFNCGGGTWYFDTDSAYVVPSGTNWNVTSWSTQAGADGGSMALMVFRDLGSGSYEVVGESLVEALTANAQNTFTLATPIAVQAGDLLGMYEDNADCGNPGGGAIFGNVSAMPAVNAVVSSLLTNPSFTANISATLNGAARAPARVAVCSVAGNTSSLDGAALPPGTFLNLAAGQAAADPHFAGATPANFVQGTGLTCDPPPAGYTNHGYAGNAQHVAENFYPYWAP
jgi:hypothetical protein